MARSKKNKFLSLEDAKRYYSDVINKYKKCNDNRKDKIDISFDKTYTTILKEYMNILMKEQDVDNQISSVSVIQPINIEYSK